MLGIELSLQLAQLIFAKFVVSSRAMLLFLVFQRRFQPRAAMQTCGGGWSDVLKGTDYELVTIVITW